MKNRICSKLKVNLVNMPTFRFYSHLSDTRRGSSVDRCARSAFWPNWSSGNLWRAAIRTPIPRRCPIWTRDKEIYWRLCEV